jgi:hypothetical protein
LHLFEIGIILLIVSPLWAGATYGHSRDHTPLTTILKKASTMAKKTSTISAVFSKEADSEDQDFLMLLDRIEKGIWRIETTVADLKISYYQLAQASSIRVSKK